MRRPCTAGPFVSHTRSVGQRRQSVATFLATSAASAPDAKTYVVAQVDVDRARWRRGVRGAGDAERHRPGAREHTAASGDRATARHRGRPNRTVSGSGSTLGACASTNAEVRQAASNPGLGPTWQYAIVRWAELIDPMTHFSRWPVRWSTRSPGSSGTPRTASWPTTAPFGQMIAGERLQRTVAPNGLTLSPSATTRRRACNPISALTSTGASLTCSGDTDS